MYTVLCTLYTEYLILYTVHCTMRTVWPFSAVQSDAVNGFDGFSGIWGWQETRKDKRQETRWDRGQQGRNSEGVWDATVFLDTEFVNHNLTYWPSEVDSPPCAQPFLPTSFSSLPPPPFTHGQNRVWYISAGNELKEGRWECHCKYIEENWFGYLTAWNLPIGVFLLL